MVSMRLLLRLALVVLLVGGWCGASAQTTREASLQPRGSKGAPCAPSGDAAWLTPAEETCYATTPDYAETMAYLKRLQEEAPAQVRIEPFGKTGEGWELDIVIASRDGVFDPAAVYRAKGPLVLVSNGIHAGEMDGKEVVVALLLEMVITKSKAGLLVSA